MVTSVLWSFWIVVLLLILWITEYFWTSWTSALLAVTMCWIGSNSILLGGPRCTVSPLHLSPYHCVWGNLRDRSSDRPSSHLIRKTSRKSFHSSKPAARCRQHTGGNLYADDTQLLASTTIHSIGECRLDLEHCVMSVTRNALANFTECIHTNRTV